ncbi:MAG: hypothetical protein AAGI13_03175 [Pseudomonadota bacterium]
MRVEREQPGCPVWVKLLMVASLTLNLVVVGLVVGQELRAHADPVRDWVMIMVPEDKHLEAEEIIARYRTQLVNLESSRNTVRAGLFDIMRAEEFQAAALTTTLANDRDISGQRRKLRHAMLVDVMALLSHEERLRGAEILQRRQERRRGERR